MDRRTISLNGKRYVVAVDPKTQQPAYSMVTKDSQPGDRVICWWPSTGWMVPISSRSRTSRSGSRRATWAGLRGRTTGRDYGVDQFAPLINTITCSTYDGAWSASIPSTSTFKPSVNLHLGGPGAAGNANGLSVINGPNAIPYAYITRNQQIAKIDLTDMTLKRAGEAFNETATSILTTRAANDAREVSVGMRNTAYRVLTGVASPNNSDTWVTNSGSEMHRSSRRPRIASWAWTTRTAGFAGTS